jgi:hypothetical protein
VDNGDHQLVKIVILQAQIIELQAQDQPVRVLAVEFQAVLEDVAGQRLIDENLSRFDLRQFVRVELRLRGEFPSVGCGPAGGGADGQSFSGTAFISFLPPSTHYTRRK